MKPAMCGERPRLGGVEVPTDRVDRHVLGEGGRVHGVHEHRAVRVGHADDLDSGGVRPGRDHVKIGLVLFHLPHAIIRARYESDFDGIGRVGQADDRRAEPGAERDVLPPVCMDVRPATGVFRAEILGREQGDILALLSVTRNRR